MLSTAIIKTAVPVAIQARAKASNKASGVVDTLASGNKARRALIRFYNGGALTSSTGGVRFRAVSCSASATLFASGTAFSTTVSSVLTSGQTAAWDINLAGTAKRFIRVKMSGVVATGANGIIIDLFDNQQFPTSSTQGFTALTRIG